MASRRWAWACRCMAAISILMAAASAEKPPAAAKGLVGVNWGSMATHPILPTSVVEMLKVNGIKKVKLFDADDWTVNALAGTDIEVMVAIPNDQLNLMTDYGRAKDWVNENVTHYKDDAKVNIKYVAVGNEPFLRSYNGSYLHTTLPALKNVQRALTEAGAHEVKATVPLNADVYDSPADDPVPSSGNFRSDIRDLMVDLVKFLKVNDAPFVVNIYPFLSLYQNENFPFDFAFFGGNGHVITDNGLTYTNVFDANYDTLVWSLKKSGVGDLKIIIGEVGWPTDGDKNASPALAEKFYNGLMKKLAANEGTPMRPGRMEVYLFSLIDEDLKSISPGAFERHWGVLRYDGHQKFKVDLAGKGGGAAAKWLAGVKGVEYLPAQWCVFNEKAKELSLLEGNMDFACTRGDCTALGFGSSCGELDANGNVSYAFNMYYQMQDQDVRACDFQGLAKITTKNASRGSCLFPVQIFSDGGGGKPAGFALFFVVAAAAVGLI